jgi:hypothetical protein
MHVVFRPPSDAQTRVWVDAVDYHPESRSEDTHLRSFRIRFVPPQVFPTSEWIVNESAAGEGERYSRFSLGLSDQENEAIEKRGDASAEIEKLRDPTLPDLERTAQVVEECWERFSAGDTSAMQYWSDDQ